MTQKEMKEILENVDPEHGWKIDHDDLYAARDYWFRNFDHATVVAEREAYWIPPYLPGKPAKRGMATTHYYFFKDGDSTEDKPLSWYRKTKTETLNLLKEAKK